MLTLFHDYTSPASAVAVARLERLVADGLPARIVGTEVVGLATALPVTVDLLAELATVEAEADNEGIVLRRPRLVPPTAAAHLVEDIARQHGRETAWRQCCYRAYWDQGADISDDTVLRELAADVDLRPTEVDRAVTDRLALLSIRQRFAAHRREGVGGVPTISFDRTLIPGLLSEDDLWALAALGPATQ